MSGMKPETVEVLRAATERAKAKQQEICDTWNRVHDMMHGHSAEVTIPAKLSEGGDTGERERTHTRGNAYVGTGGVPMILVEARGLPIPLSSLELTVPANTKGASGTNGKK